LVEPFGHLHVVVDFHQFERYDTGTGVPSATSTAVRVPRWREGSG
jgi:hypothetical protein